MTTTPRASLNPVRRRFAVIAVMAVLAHVSGCSIGPETVPRDRNGYGEMLGRSAREELLKNIVRLRYMESPVFLTVNSVVNQYSLDVLLTAGAAVNWGELDGSGTSLTGSGRYADRPTITYAPMYGKKFTETIITPIRAESVLTLIESGWRAETMLPLCVHSINGVRNRFYFGARQQQLDPQFARIVQIIGRLQAEGAMSLRLMESEVKGQPSFVMVVSAARTDEQNQLLAEVVSILGLDPGADHYRITFGSMARDDKEIALVTRSILAILADMSTYVRVPQSDIDEGRASPGAPTGEELVHPLVVHAGEKAPLNYYVRIRHRGLWYWIDDTDMRSKGTFSTLIILTSIAESSDAVQAPLLTIPTG
jgi:hypothetical protein